MIVTEATVLRVLDLTIAAMCGVIVGVAIMLFR